MAMLNRNILIRKNIQNKIINECRKKVYSIETFPDIDVLRNFVQNSEESGTSWLEDIIDIFDTKDKFTKEHCIRTMEISIGIAKYIGLSQNELMDIYHGGVLHDIGKLFISNNILNKDSKLTDAEYEIMKEHPISGFNVLRNISGFEIVRRIVLEHHERIDGLGYPYGLKGSEIHPLAKIVSVSDAYDAMTSWRPYRKVYLSDKQAMEILIKNKGKQFDSYLVDALVYLCNNDKINKNNKALKAQTRAAFR